MAGCETRQEELAGFLERLDAALLATVARISVTTLHGGTCEVATVQDAVRCIEQYDESEPRKAFVRYEVCVRYSNGDRIEAEFEAKRTAIEFLRGFAEDARGENTGRPCAGKPPQPAAPIAPASNYMPIPGPDAPRR